MKTLLAAALLTSPLALSTAYAANEPRTGAQETRIKNDAKKEQKAESETVYTTIYEANAKPASKSSVDVSIRIKNSWADIYLRFNLG